MTAHESCRRYSILIKARSEVTIPFERTRALIETKHFLQRLLDPKESPRVPRWVRGKARSLLRHYPTYADIELAHNALPEWYGPVPPFSRLHGSDETDGVIQAASNAAAED
jgi:hypothetical protein